MKSNFFHKLFSLLLAILILVSTSSFTVEKHFCKGFLIDYSIFTTLKKCNDAPCSDNTKEEDTEDPECCNDVVDIVEGQDVVTTRDLNDLDYHQQVFLFAFTVSFNELFNYTSVPKVRYKDYHSPFLITDKLVDHQTFLI